MLILLSRQQRLRERFKSRAVGRCSNVKCYTSCEKVVRLNDLEHTKHVSNLNHTVQEIHDILQAYYKVARKRFVDNVRMQVADFFLVTGPETPLTLFCPNFVAAMSAEQLEDIAGEDLLTKNKRARLEKTIEELEIGKKIVSSR